MVADMIAIVPAFVVIFCIDTGNTVFITVIWFTGIDESMLRPVTHHHNDTGHDKGQDKYHEGGREINE
jgi:hypothetical protein